MRLKMPKMMNGIHHESHSVVIQKEEQKTFVGWTKGTVVALKNDVVLSVHVNQD